MVVNINDKYCRVGHGSQGCCENGRTMPMPIPAQSVPTGGASLEWHRYFHDGHYVPVVLYH